MNIKNLQFIRDLDWLLGRKVLNQLGILTIFQFFATFLDIIFLALLSTIPSLLVNTNSNQVDLGHLLHFRPNLIRSIILLLIILMLKSTITLLIQFLAVRILGKREGEVSGHVFQIAMSKHAHKQSSINSVDLLQTLQTSLNLVFANIVRPLTTFFSDLFTVMLIVSGLILISPFSVFISTIFSGIFIILIYRFIDVFQKRIGSKVLEIDRESLFVFNEFRRNSTEFSLANRDLALFNKYRTLRTNLAILKGYSFRISAIPRFALELLVVASIGLVTFTLTKNLKSTELLSILTVFVGASFRIIPSLGSVLAFLGNAKASKASFDRVVEIGLILGIRNQNINWHDNDESQEFDTFSGNLVLRNVSYRYPNSKKDLFSNVNLELVEGTTTLLIGASGRGKTTLSMIILGLLEPTSGTIEINSQGKTQAYTGKRFKGKSLLRQEVPLYEGSFGFNISSKKFFIDDENKIIEAAKNAGIYEKILRTAKGLNFEIGENGSMLSAGERQRLGLARCLYEDPKLLVLDEPTANLDVESEKEIWKIIQNLKGKMTIILISHRPVPRECYDERYEIIK